jgi:hypothetical protein
VLLAAVEQVLEADVEVSRWAAFASRRLQV